LSAAIHVAYGINAVVVKNESLKLATRRETLYGNWTGREGGREGGRGEIDFCYIVNV
jgi:hypothetical protein